MGDQKSDVPTMRVETVRTEPGLYTGRINHLTNGFLYNKSCKIAPGFTCLPGIAGWLPGINHRN